MVSQRPDHPLTNRRKIGGKSEPFSKSSWKFLRATRLVCLSLLYGENCPDRMNMAIMQEQAVLLGKIAKKQDGIKLRWAYYGQRKMSLTKTKTKFFRSGWCQSKCPAPAERGSGIFLRHLNSNVNDSLTVRLPKIRMLLCIPDFSHVYFAPTVEHTMSLT